MKISLSILFALMIILTNLNDAPAQQKITEAISLPILTKKEMFEDFDQFVETVSQISPQTPVRKEVTGIDPLGEIKKLRKQILKLKSTKEFAYLIRAAINTLQDGHSSLVWSTYGDNYLNEVGISDEAIKLLPKYYELLVTFPRKKNKFDLKLQYIDGEYYNIVPFNHNEKIFETGLKLIEVNGKNVHSVVKDLYPYVRMMRWDFERKRYYKETFYKADNFSSEEPIKLKFLDENGNTKVSSFKLSEGLNFTRLPEGTIDKEKKVEYFADEQILYVRLPKMDFDFVEFYPAEIKAKGMDRPIKKVIIDIRDNRGGTDNVWFDALRAIIKEPIVYTDYLLCNPSPLMIKKFPKELKDWKPYRANSLNGHKYAIFATGERKIEPFDDSINFNGNIYVLQNENIYSSSGAMAAISVLAPNIYTVGQNTGLLLGRGINPEVFELANSKIIYRLEPVIDFLNVSKAKDVFHDTVEIPVILTLEDYLRWMNNPRNRYKKEFLFNNDPVFMRAIND